MRALLLLVAFALVAPSVALPVASACASGLTTSVPCGRIYPIITISSDGPAAYNLTQGGAVDIDAKINFAFDAYNEGYSPVPPTDPITITFEFPRKPVWADMTVTPDSIPVDVNNPTYFTPDPSNPSGPQVKYSYTTSIKIHVALAGQAVLRDGIDYAKLLVFAKSSENGLYQSGYGIKEVRVIPAGALHESDVAGSRDVFTATPLDNFTTTVAKGKADGISVTLTPPASGSFWVPQKFSAKIEPAPTGLVVASLFDEWGTNLYTTQALDASSGTLAFTATLVKPGLYTAAYTLLPDAQTPPLTIPVDFVAGALDAEGFAYPKDYVVVDDAVTTAPNGNTADPLAQTERDFPVFAFDSAQSLTATITLATPGQDLGKGAANAQLILYDPEGKILQTASADPLTYPQRTLRIGSVPVEGWYTLRVRAAGLPAESSWNVKAEVAYATPPEARNRADGRADLTPSVSSRAGQNVTLPTGNLSLWAPGDLTPKMEKLDGARYGITVLGPNATLAYASGLRAGKASFTAAQPGSYSAFVYVEPSAPGTPFSPTVRLFRFDVGASNITTATKFAIADSPEMPQAPMGEVIALYAVPLGQEAKVDVKTSAPGATVTQTPGKADAGGATKLIVVSATNPGPAAAASVAATIEYGSPQTLVGPLAKSGEAPKGVAAPGVLLGILGVAGAALLVSRRKRA